MVGYIHNTNLFRSTKIVHFYLGTIHKFRNCYSGDFFRDGIEPVKIEQTRIALPWTLKFVSGLSHTSTKWRM